MNPEIKPTMVESISEKAEQQLKMLHDLSEQAHALGDVNTLCQLTDTMSRLIDAVTTLAARCYPL